MAVGVAMATATGTVSSLGITGAAKYIAPSVDDVSFGLGLLGAATAGMAACGAANIVLGEAHAEVGLETFQVSLCFCCRRRQFCNWSEGLSKCIRDKGGH